ncbi:MAG: hypothetical protein ACRDMV_23420 [Streptosporangiales bacterium]
MTASDQWPTQGEREARQAESAEQHDEATDRVAEAVERLSDPERPIEGKERRRLLAGVAKSIAGSTRSVHAHGLMGWMGGVLEAVTPRLRVRDLETLRAHHHGLTGEALADSLVEASSRGSAVVGAAGGALAAVEYAAPPTLLSVPVQIAAETLVVAAIEIKLIAELHEVYGVEVGHTGRQRGTAYVQAWAKQRGVNALEPGSLTAALGAGARRELRQRLLARLGRNLTTLGPLLTGAVAGGYLNRRGTKRLAGAVRDDLRGRTLLVTER